VAGGSEVLFTVSPVLSFLNAATDGLLRRSINAA